MPSNHSNQHNKQIYKDQFKPCVRHIDALFLLDGTEDEVTFLAKKLASMEANSAIDTLFALGFDYSDLNEF